MTTNEDQTGSAPTSSAPEQSVDAQAARPPEPKYRCAACGSVDVQVQFPVWMASDNVDDRSRWEPDYEATPRGHCRTCDAADRDADVVPVRITDADGCGDAPPTTARVEATPRHSPVIREHVEVARRLLRHAWESVGVPQWQKVRAADRYLALALGELTDEPAAPEPSDEEREIEALLLKFARAFLRSDWWAAEVIQDGDHEGELDVSAAVEADLWKRAKQAVVEQQRREAETLAKIDQIVSGKVELEGVDVAPEGEQLHDDAEHAWGCIKRRVPSAECECGAEGEA